jgi:pimeloyl-ACP methyl ester carboxylesterase
MRIRSYVRRGLALALVVACSFARASDCEPLRVHEYVKIGGIDQWITIDGDDCRNPVVLFVHGGPGNPLSPYMAALYGTWKTQFTIATWDQRLAGRTYARNDPAMTLSTEQIVSDGLEVAEHLRHRLGARKLILTGASWGSVVGLQMAHRRPELFHAYVGVSQLVNWRDNEAASYAAVLAIAKRKNDVAALTMLAEIGPPPWKDPRSFGRKRRLIRSYESEITTPGPQLSVSAEYASDADRAAYTEGEDAAYIQYVGLAGDGVATAIDLRGLGTRYALPVFIIQGTEDLLTHTSVTEAFFEPLKAPRKTLLMVPGAGHDPNFAMIEDHLRVLMEWVRPLTR